jgi:hypothetical protein
MPEVLVEFAESVADEAGNTYTARACGGEMPDGRWQGWIEFVPVGSGEPLRTSRETTQPNYTDVAYWATGLTPIYLEGALHRAQKPLTRPAAQPAAPPIFEAPAPATENGSGTVDSVLNPFSVIRKGEPLLRRQLAALSSWHLVNIVRDFRLSDRTPVELDGMTAAELIDLIVAATRRQSAIASE